MNLEQAAREALEFLDWLPDTGHEHQKARMHLRAALDAGQAQAVPSGWVLVRAYSQCGRWADDAPGTRADCAEKFKRGTPCEKCPDAAPPAPAVQQPLTEKQIMALRKWRDMGEVLYFDKLAFAREVERAHGIGAKPTEGGPR